MNVQWRPKRGILLRAGAAVPGAGVTGAGDAGLSSRSKCAFFCFESVTEALLGKKTQRQMDEATCLKS